MLLQIFVHFYLSLKANSESHNVSALGFAETFSFYWKVANPLLCFHPYILCEIQFIFLFYLFLFVLFLLSPSFCFFVLLLLCQWVSLHTLLFAFSLLLLSGNFSSISLILELCISFLTVLFFSTSLSLLKSKGTGTYLYIWYICGLISFHE